MWGKYNVLSAENRNFSRFKIRLYRKFIRFSVFFFILELGRVLCAFRHRPKIDGLCFLDVGCWEGERGARNCE